MVNESLPNSATNAPSVSEAVRFETIEELSEINPVSSEHAPPWKVGFSRKNGELTYCKAMEKIMRKTILLAAAGALFATGASAAPLLNQGNSILHPTTLENVRMVCTEDGRCYRTGGRRYVERRYYGDSYAYASRRAYVGPGYGYSDPGYGYSSGPGYYTGGPSIGFSFGTGRW